ncbi:MAG: NYN domain-containing protein, partial [Betaproteobacteria bacterium]|nr:NYN domain-containing protein [Betaproteobacteria bacterium]
MPATSKTKAVVFIDGGNFYHYAKEKIGVNTGDLDFAAFSQKLVMGRNLTDVRYYVGKVSGGRSRAYAGQQRFLN